MKVETKNRIRWQDFVLAIEPKWKGLTWRELCVYVAGTEKVEKRVDLTWNL